MPDDRLNGAYWQEIGPLGGEWRLMIGGVASMRWDGRPHEFAVVMMGQDGYFYLNAESGHSGVFPDLATAKAAAEDTWQAFSTKFEARRARHMGFH